MNQFIVEKLLPTTALFCILYLGCQKAPIKHKPVVDRNLSPTGTIIIDNRKMGSFRDIGPIEFIELLEKNQGKAFHVGVPHHDWINDKDLEQIVALVDSERPCANVTSVHSSLKPSKHNTTTVGKIARWMVGGFAGYSRFPSVTVDCWTGEDANRWWKSYSSQYGTKIHNAFVLFQVSKERQGERGYVITNPSHIVFCTNANNNIMQNPSRLNALKEYFDGQNRIQELIERADRPEEYLAVYVLLNEIYPELSLDIISGGFETDIIGYGEIPVEFNDGDDTINESLSPESFGKLVKTYWTRKLFSSSPKKE